MLREWWRLAGDMPHEPTWRERLVIAVPLLVGLLVLAVKW